MIEASAEKVAAMLEEARLQHPEETDGQHRKRVAYRLNALRKKDKIEVLHERIAKMESQDWRWWLIIAMFALFLILFGVSQAHCQIAPNINLQRIAGTNIASGIYDSGNTAFKVNCVVGCSATAGFSDNSAFTVGTTTINVIGGYYTSGAAPTLSTGNAGRARIDASSFLMVNCASGCSGGATTPADTFTNPTTAGLSMVFPAVWNGTTWDRLYGDKTNGAFVNIKNSVALAVTGTFWQSTQPVSTADGSQVTLGAKADAKSTATDTTAVTIMQVLKEISAMEQAPASRAVTNAGTFAVQAGLPTTVDTNSGLKSASTLRVVLATDQPALTNKLLVTPDSVALPANQSVNVNQLAGTTTDTNSGTKSAGTLRVVLATDQPQLTNKLLVTPDANSAVNVAQVGGTAVVADPCQSTAKLFVSITQTANTQLVTGTSAKKIYICSVNVVTAAANNVALVEGTGTVCATGIAGVQGFGGSTAATGWNFAANGGIAYGDGGHSVGGEGTNADNLCLLQSAAVQLTGGISYVVQ